MKSVERVDFANVIVGGEAAFDVIGLEQRRRRLTAQHAIELPGQIFRVLKAGIGAPRAERRDLMCSIAGEDDAAVDEAVHAPALELVERNPFELELVVTQHACDPRPHIVGLLLDRGIGIAAELQVDAPDVVRLLVQQRRTSGVERRIEPEPALGRECRRHLDVGDQELVLEHLAGKFRTNHPPQGRARAVAGNDVSRVQLIGSLGGIDGQHHAIVALFECGHLVAPAQGNRRKLRDTVDQIGLGIELLEVDEGRPLVALLGQKVELIKLLVAMKDLADAPHHALVDHALADAEPVPILQRAFRKADRPRAFADAVGVVEQHDVLPALREVDRKGKPDRACTDHHDLVFGNAGAALIWMAPIAELGFGLIPELGFHLRHLSMILALARR